MKSCTIPGCPNSHDARGFCSKHYAAWRAHGDPLLRLPIGPDPQHLTWQKVSLWHAQGLHDAAIARIIGRSRTRVGQVRVRLGLSRNPFWQAFTLTPAHIDIETFIPERVIAEIDEAALAEMVEMELTPTGDTP